MVRVSVISSRRFPRRCASPARAEALAAACHKTYPQQTLDMSRPLNLGQLKNKLYFYACSGAYDSDLNKVLAGCVGLCWRSRRPGGEARDRARYRQHLALQSPSATEGNHDCSTEEPQK